MDVFIEKITTTWWGITAMIILLLLVIVLLSALFYRIFFKRFYDVLLSGVAILILSPLLLVLTVVGAIKMKGNPFFTQLRPGKINKRTKKEKIFKLIKFRTMTCEKDENGDLLPDEKRLTKYGKFLRSTSLDELPELINILIGNMSIVGPRPLLVKYLPLYSEEQRKRHEVRPGLTGYAQVNGRNVLSWEEKFFLDVEYVKKQSFLLDVAIIFKTIITVFKRDGISSETSVTMEEFMGDKQGKVDNLRGSEIMKILQVVKTNRGATWALNQAIHLKKMGIEIITVMPNVFDGIAEKYKENGLSVIEGDWRLPIKKPWRYFSVCKHIRQTIKQVQPDILHLHFVTNVLMCRLALRKDKTPRLFQVPGPLHLESGLTSCVERRMATKVDYWAGACKKTCSIYKEKGVEPNRVHLAYYGIPHKDVSEGAAKNVLRSEYGIPDDAVIVAMVSYFYKPKKYLGQKRGIKGHEDFIDAIRLVIKKHPNIVPVIIGNAWDGAEAYEKKVKAYAKKKLGDKIIFTGYRGDIYDIYPEIDLVVHPSHSENLGGAAESLMLAVPTISSDVGGFPDIVIPGETGCLVKSKNSEDLAEKIVWAIENPKEMKDMARKGQELVKELLGLKNTATKVHEVYVRILQNEGEKQR